jgi:hypothetical protein
MSDRIKDNGSADAPSPREPETYDHAGIRALAKALGLKMSALTVLGRDPFTADGTGGNSESDGRIAGAEWFAEEVYKRLDITPEARMRRIHYKLMSQDLPILMLNGAEELYHIIRPLALRHEERFKVHGIAVRRFRLDDGNKNGIGIWKVGKGRQFPSPDEGAEKKEPSSTF